VSSDVFVDGARPEKVTRKENIVIKYYRSFSFRKRSHTFSVAW